MMRSTLFWLGLAGVILSGTAGAEEFACEVPWYERWVDCSKSMFSVRAGEKLTIKVTEFTDGDLEPASGTPIFSIYDQNKKEELRQLRGAKGTSGSWTNATGKECIVVLGARVSWEGTRIIRGSYTVTPR